MTMRKNKLRKKPAANRRFLFGLTGCLIALAALGLIAAAGAGGAAWWALRHFSQDLPGIAALQNYRPPLVTTVYASNGEKIAEFYKERRFPAPLEKMPKHLIHAFVAAEDARFFSHPGVDIRSIARAAIQNWKAGRVVQGGSTITQQVAKYFLLTPERSYRRKIREAILALRIEDTLPKEKILYLYLNQIYLGHAAHGVQAAAENYFGKNVDQLALAESAMLAGLPQAPSDYSPFHHPDKAKDRQKYVLGRMVAEGYISRSQADAAEALKLDIKPRRNYFREQVPFYTEHVRRYVVDKYGEDALYNGGLQIYTAVDIAMQKAARRAVNRGLRELDRRHGGYRGAPRRLEADAVDAFIADMKSDQEFDPPAEGGILMAVVTHVDMAAERAEVAAGNLSGSLSTARIRWEPDVAPKRLQKGDVVEVTLKKVGEAPDRCEFALSQTPESEGALLCIETGTGLARAMVGGKDYKSSQFNRAVQARRQPGSAFKPIIYAAALDKGYTPASVIIDNAVIYEGRGHRGHAWKPKNYDRTFHGPILLRKALAKSRNLSTIQILHDIGVDYAVDYARKLGITADLYPDLSLALGASGVSLLELTRAYSVFANLGRLIEPVFVTRILDRDGNVLEEAHTQGERVIEAATAYLMTSLLQSVVQEGTGARVRALGRPAAGKTGTTNDLHDAWFMGYTPGFVTGAWVGYDQEQSLGAKETGARAAIPIWLEFMQKILEGRPERNFSVPEGVVFARIDAETGLLALDETPSTRFENFKAGTAPTQYTQPPGAVSDAGSFFKSDM